MAENSAISLQTWAFLFSKISLKPFVEDENQKTTSSLAVDVVGMITRINKAHAFFILSWSTTLIMPTAYAWPLIDILDLHERFLYNSKLSPLVMVLDDDQGRQFQTEAAVVRSHTMFVT